MALGDLIKGRNEQLSESKKELVATVEKALTCLKPELKTIVLMRYWDQLTLKQISYYTGISPIEVRSRLLRAHNVLRPLLAAYVTKHWHFQPQGTCLICRHPQLELINKMLLQKDPDEAWGEFGEELAKAIGQRIHPPRLLIIHLEHIRIKEAENA